MSFKYKYYLKLTQIKEMLHSLLIEKPFGNDSWECHLGKSVENASWESQLGTLVGKASWES